MSNYLDENGLTRYDQRIKNYIDNITSFGLSYITEAPTAANTNGKLIIVLLTETPTTKYDGYLYIILE